MLILASASPRRSQLLADAGFVFSVAPCRLPEPTQPPPGLSPVRWAEALAYFKASAVAREHPDAWVLGADTLVACAGELLGKPSDAADAQRMLQLQAGRRSDVITGVALVHRAPSQRHLTHAVTGVWMRDDPALITEYVASGDWAGKAGAYGIQTVGDRLIERLDGSFSNVVGLPIELIVQLLATAGLQPRPTGGLVAP